MYSDPIPCTINDEMMRLGYLAEESNELHKLLHEVPVSESIQQWSRKEEVEGWGKNPDVRNIKIVQIETSEMVAHAQWLFCSAVHGADLGEPQDLHPEINKEHYVSLLRDHENKKLELMSGKTHLREYLISTLKNKGQLSFAILFLRRGQTCQSKLQEEVLPRTFSKSRALSVNTDSAMGWKI